MLQQAGYGVRRVGHRRVAEDREGAGRGVLDEPDRRVEDQPEGALGADQEPVEPAAPLGQQVLEGVAGDLAPEPAELGAHRAEVLVDQRIELRAPSVTTDPSASSTVSASTLSTVRP